MTEPLALVFLDALRNDVLHVSRFLWRYDRWHLRNAEVLVAALERDVGALSRESSADYYECLLFAARPQPRPSRPA